MLGVDILHSPPVTPQASFHFYGPTFHLQEMMKVKKKRYTEVVKRFSLTWNALL